MFTIEEVESAIQGIALGLRQSTSWSLAIYSLANGVSINDAEAGCNTWLAHDAAASSQFVEL